MKSALSWDDTNLGVVLLQLGFISKESLSAAVAKQKASPGARLGEVLLAMGTIEEAQLKTGLDVQRQLRSKSARGVMGGMMGVMRANVERLRSRVAAVDDTVKVVLSKVG